MAYRGESQTDYSAARLEQIEVTFGAEERALKLSGSGDIRFGASPLLRAALSARQLDADKFSPGTMPPSRFARYRRCGRSAAVVPHLPISAQIELASEQVMLGGRPLQDIAAELPATTNPGACEGWIPRARRDQGFAQRGRCEERCAGPVQGRAQRRILRSRGAADLAAGPRRIAYRSQKPLRLRGDVTVAPEGFAIDAMKADIDGGTVEGRVTVSHRQADSGSRLMRN